MTDDLAGEFQRVDAASDFAVFSNCLTSDRLASVFRRVQARELSPSRRQAWEPDPEVGCGLGDDAAALARRVAPGGSVVAVDGSQTMVRSARERHGDVAACRSTSPTRLTCRSTTRVSMLPGRSGASAHWGPARESARWSA